MTSGSARLVATLGGKAQVVTFALDALRADGVTIDEVLLLHLAPRDPTHRLRIALDQARKAFRQSGVSRVREVLFCDATGAALTDSLDQAATSAIWHTLREQIGGLTQQRQPIHLCVTGGPRLLALLSLSVAALHFRAQDRVWHLFTDPALRQAAGDGAILHAPPGYPAPSLIEVPIMPGTEAIPALRSLLAASPEQVYATRRAALSAEERRACASVWAALTRRQRDVLGRVAAGAPPSDVAAELVIAPSTVASHLNAIYKQCRVAWGLPERETLDYRWLRERFAGWEG